MDHRREEEEIKIIKNATDEIDIEDAKRLRCIEAKLVVPRYAVVLCSALTVFMLYRTSREEWSPFMCRTMMTPKLIVEHEDPSLSCYYRSRTKEADVSLAR